MSLNNARNAAVTAIAFDALVGAESMKLHAYSAFTLLFMQNASADTKRLRMILAIQAEATGVIAKNTWESYVKGVEVAASKFRTNLTADADFLAIFTMAPEDAVDEVRKLYEALNVLSGSDIREWSKAEGFAPLDKAAAKAAKAAADKQRRMDAARAEHAIFMASNGDMVGATGAPIVDMAAPVSPLDAILAAIGALGTEADALKAMDALNTRLLSFQAIKAEPTTAPVLADDAMVDAKSRLAQHFAKVA